MAMFLYLADVASNFQGVLSTLSFLSGFAGLILTIVKLAHQTDPRDANVAASVKPYGTPLLIVAIVFGFFAAAIPSKNTMYMIAAVKVGESIAEKPQVQQFSSKVMALIDVKLDEAIEKATKPKKND